MSKRFIVGLSLCSTFLSAQVAYGAIKKESHYLHENKPIVIAVIDTGADISHPDLKNYIWTNLGEMGLDSLGLDKKSNGIDDDDNGFVDDIHGWNFVENSNRVFDVNGHGTHISGIIKNEFKNLNAKQSTSTSAAPVRLMILKYYDPKGKLEDSIKFSVQAIKYANMMNANIINYSGGGDESSASELAAIRQSEKLGILFVAAAGNGRANTDIKKYYPANYGLSNIISVGATNEEGDYASFSNYGNRSVDIAAPGKDINSTLPNSKFGLMSGTSQATAFVTGAAAKMLSIYKGKLSPKDTIELLLKSSRAQSTLAGKTKHRLALLNN